MPSTTSSIIPRSCTTSTPSSTGSGSLASDDVLAAADRSATGILERYFQPNLSPEEMRELMLTRPNDPLKEFSEVCRLELQTLQRRA